MLLTALAAKRLVTSMAETKHDDFATRPKPRRAARWAKRLGYAVFLLVCVELSLQVFYRVTHGAFLYQRMAIPIFRADPIRGWAVKPNLDYTHTTNEFSVQLYTNSQGMRVSKDREEFAIQKDPSRYRVMLLGPSFAFGWAASFEDSFAHRLETYLEAAGFASGRDVEIINAGVPSMFPANNLDWYQQVGKRYRPDLVIQLIHWKMGVSNRLSEKFSVTDDGYLVPSHPSRGRRVKDIVKKFGIVFYPWSIFVKLKGWFNGGDVTATTKQLEGSDRPANPSWAFDLSHPGMIDSLNFYDRLCDTVTGDGTRLLVVFLPSAYCVHREDVGRWYQGGQWDTDAEIGFNRTFCEHLNSQGITCLNIHDSLVDAARRNKERLYYWLDVHWTALGNDVAAGAVADYLLDRQEK